MTVTYSAEVATSKGFGCFWKLLFRWRGSIYKLLWPDLGLYLSFYYFLSIIYRFTLTEDQRRYFEKVSLYCKTYGDLIPVSFILGFYVSIVVKRWWDSFNCIPWPDTLAFFVSAYIHGQDDRGRLMRRSIMRYANLAFVITLTCISPCVKKRFPTMDHLVDAGILLPNEKDIMEQLKTSHSKYWMPLVWASSIAIRARKEGRIRDDFALNTLVEAIANYRSLCGGLYNYDWISIPLVYTQVVTLVVYTFFLATLMGRQYLDPKQGHPGYDVDLYIPIFNFLQFFFYMGWLKVAETLVNPFGEDDDDFEVNWVIDRDIQVSYLIVDEMHQEHPELIKDQYWDEVMPDLPYTAAAMPFYTEPPMGSAANLVIPPHEAEFVPLETLEENEDELDGVKVINGIPCETTNNRSLLSNHLSGSAFSGISKLGRSFHPMSYERKGIINMMQDFLSRESSVRKKKLWKAPSKDSTLDPSASCETSGPPTPEEYKDRGGFNDDIFHLSDLSLADSRGTGAQSPGYYSNMPVEDIFWQRRYKGSNRYLQRSASKVSTPKSEAPDESLRLPTVMRKKSTNSLKQFFRSGKYRSSQKSLIGSVHGRSKLTMKTDNNRDTDSIAPDKRDDNRDDENSLTNSDEEVTVRESYQDPQDMSKSTTDIDAEKSPRASAPISFSRPRKSLPQELEFSPNNRSLGKLGKDSSTSTLVPIDGSLEGTPPAENQQSGYESDSSKKSVFIETSSKENFQSNSTIDMNMDNNTLNDNIKSNPCLSKPSSIIPQKNVLNKFRPKRAASLHMNEYHKDGESPSTSGLQKFFDRNKSRSFFRTMSQPVSPTGSEAPVLRSNVPSRKSLFSRRSSKDKQNKSSSNLQSENNAEVSPTQSMVEQNNLKNLASKSSDV
ncbi:bestrophin-2 [Caerostris darwini]|uniref:Bestrophin-2 n=1 Tax=Caerostris darwini TaxID=1538125 RepID=A0AAV4VTS7_9ARAC|nr:bestrophin-2 [Caerostris darwini]